MARTFGMRAQGLQITYILNIDGAVGKNSLNRRDDVMLVQYLLKVWLAHEKDLVKLTPMLASTPILTVNGFYDDKMKRVINTFEIFHQTLSINQDGRVDPAFQNNSRKIWSLNQILFFAGGLQGGIPETRIPFPPELITPLYR